ncbi:hypothetical protein FOXB_16676 [Fusarium oxysporum f. sp. conglutinans Fo5176]|uniref:Uncharacterized protein n=1 Tax=Fusarium oxysporum (strain Fo5176) TaxID=660025 RepID=F9GDE2_FUSOF|nr:hypothetical protein FOXB_16676 [Fusarium oxysporum f. sp. conglutinans Fo5176]
MNVIAWDRTFEGADCQTLISLSDLPLQSSQPLYLGMHCDGHELKSSVSDENKLLSIVAALDRLFDQRAETVRFTDVSIRRWLRSRFPDRPYKAPFELVSQSTSERLYRGEFKRCICFWLRVWRLPMAISRSIVGRTLSRPQHPEPDADGEEDEEGGEDDENEEDGSDFFEFEDTASDTLASEDSSGEEDDSGSQRNTNSGYRDYDQGETRPQDYTVPPTQRNDSHNQAVDAVL